MGTISRGTERIIQAYQVEITSHNLLDYQMIKRNMNSVMQAPFNDIYLQVKKDSLVCNKQQFPDFQIKLQMENEVLNMIPYQKFSQQDILMEKDQYFWQVARKGLCDWMPLQVGDVLKIGKQKIMIADLIKNNASCSQKQLKQQQCQIDIQPSCRICALGPDQLIDVCKCSGSLKYIHKSCLKEWIISKVKQVITTKNNTFAYSSSCQICGSKYRFKPNNLFQQSQDPYIVLQYKRQKKLYSIITPAQKILIGRNLQSSFVLKDVSISRTHCYITYQNGQLRVYDSGSKFGTLKLVRKSIQLPRQQQWFHKQNYIFKIKQSSKITCQPWCGQEIEE